jgi:hypothetical protein
MNEPQKESEAPPRATEAPEVPKVPKESEAPKVEAPEAPRATEVPPKESEAPKAPEVPKAAPPEAPIAPKESEAAKPNLSSELSKNSVKLSEPTAVKTQGANNKKKPVEFSNEQDKTIKNLAKVLKRGIGNRSEITDFDPTRLLKFIQEKRNELDKYPIIKAQIEEYVYKRRYKEDLDLLTEFLDLYIKGDKGLDTISGQEFKGLTNNDARQKFANYKRQANNKNKVVNQIAELMARGESEA